MLFRSFLVFSFLFAVVSISEAQFRGAGVGGVGGPIDRWNSNPTYRLAAITAENVRHPVATDWKAEVKRQEEILAKPELPKLETLQQELPQNYAVLIGVNQYELNVTDHSIRQDQLSFPNLMCCVNDTNALAEILEKGKFAPKENIFVMNNEAKDPAMLPTKKNIIAYLARVIASVKDGDTCLVTFSGHGCSFPIGEGKMRGYVCPAGTDVYKSRESGLWNLETLIAVADLFAGLESRKGVKKIAILDACRNSPLDSGEKGGKSGFRSIHVTDTRGKVVGLLADHYVFSETDLQSYQNLFRLTSCSQGQLSYEDQKIRHGIFTKCLLDGLSGQADINRDGKVSIEELAVYVKETTPPYAEKVWKLKQEPLSSSNEFGTCVLTRNEQSP